MILLIIQIIIKESTPDTMNTDKDPFESFGEQIEISDNDLPF